MTTYHFRTDADHADITADDLDHACATYAHGEFPHAHDAASLIQVIDQMDGAWLLVTDDDGRHLICVGDLPEAAWQRVVPNASQGASDCPYPYAVRFAYATERHERGEIVSFHRTRAAAERAAKRCAFPSHVEIAEFA